MNIETMRAFLEVSATGSFQQSAENLHITQSAMSARIKGLEDSLNRQLFNRKRNGATLTSGGRAFYRHALSVVRTWELARQEIALSHEASGVVSLGVQLNHWKSTAAPWLRWMQSHASDTATQLHSDYSDRLMSMLRDGLLDIAILYEPQHNPDIVIQEYAVESLVMVSTVPRTVEAGIVPGYVYVDWGHGFRAEHSRAFPEAASHQMTVGLSSVGLDHILEQGGSGYFLYTDVAGLVEQNRLFLVENAPEFKRTTYLAFFAETGRQPTVQLALEGLKQIQMTDSKSKGSF